MNPEDLIPFDETVPFETYISQAPDTLYPLNVNFELPRLAALPLLDNLKPQLVGNISNRIDGKAHKRISLHLFRIDNGEVTAPDYHLLIWSNSFTGLQEDNSVLNFASNYAEKYKVHVKLVAIQTDLTTDENLQEKIFTTCFDNSKAFDIENGGLAQLAEGAEQIHTFGGGVGGAFIKNSLDIGMINSNYIDPNKMYGFQWGAPLDQSGYYALAHGTTLTNLVTKKQVNVYSDRVAEGTRSYKHNESLEGIINVKVRENIYDADNAQMENFLFRQNGYFTVRDFTDEGKIYYNASNTESSDVMISYVDDIIYPAIYPRNEKQANLVSLDHFAQITEKIHTLIKENKTSNPNITQEELQAIIKNSLQNEDTIELFKLFNYRARMQFKENTKYDIEHKPTQEGKAAKITRYAASKARGGLDYIKSLAHTPAKPEGIKSLWPLVEKTKTELDIQFLGEISIPGRMMETIHTTTADDTGVRNNPLLNPIKLDRFKKDTSAVVQLESNNPELSAAKVLYRENFQNSNPKDISIREVYLYVNGASEPEQITNVLIFCRTEQRGAPAPIDFFRNYAAFLEKNTLAIIVTTSRINEKSLVIPYEVGEYIFTKHISQHLTSSVLDVTTFGGGGTAATIKNSIDIAISNSPNDLIRNIALSGLQWAAGPISKYPSISQDFYPNVPLKNQINVYSGIGHIKYKGQVVSEIRNIKVKTSEGDTLNESELADFLFNHNGYLAIQYVKNTYYYRRDRSDDFYIAWDTREDEIIPILQYTKYKNDTSGESDYRETGERGDTQGISLDTIYSRKMIELLEKRYGRNIFKEDTGMIWSNIKWEE